MSSNTSFKMGANVRMILLIALIATTSLSSAADTDSWLITSSGCRVFASGPEEKNLKVSWTGACSDGFADGNGVLSWSNGSRYEGEVYVGKRSGKGTLYWSNGDWYEGDFKDGRREGFGTHHYGCKGTYHGEFHRGVMDGVGVLDMVDGNHYEGEFHNGLMDGLGKRSFADGSEYEGEFRRNQQEGLGRLLLANHSRYEGEFVNGRPEGHAMVTYPSGDVFEGTYVEGHAEGRGIATKPNGERDVGIFKDNKGVLKLVSNIGAPLYESCSTHCTDTTPSCRSATTSAISPSDPSYQMKLMNAAVDCGREMQQCKTLCERHNPTVRELKGVVEIGELGDANTLPTDPVAREAQVAANKKALSFADEQMAATGELRMRLTQQQQQLQSLQQRLTQLPTTRPTVSSNAAASDCKPARRKR